MFGKGDEMLEDAGGQQPLTETDGGPTSMTASEKAPETAFSAQPFLAELIRDVWRLYLSAVVDGAARLDSTCAAAKEIKPNFTQRTA